MLSVLLKGKKIPLIGTDTTETYSDIFKHIQTDRQTGTDTDKGTTLQTIFRQARIHAIDNLDSLLFDRDPGEVLWFLSLMKQQCIILDSEFIINAFKQTTFVCLV